MEHNNYSDQSFNITHKEFKKKGEKERGKKTEKKVVKKVVSSNLDKCEC